MDARDLLAASREVLRATEHALGLDAGDLLRAHASVAVLLSPECLAAVFDRRGALLHSFRGATFPGALGSVAASFVTAGVAALDQPTRDLLAHALDRQLCDLSLLIDPRAATIRCLLTARRDPERHVELFAVDTPMQPEMVH